ncbi:AAA family ATPase, partial [Sphingorhabdus sp.]|uniref:AAA family ATPase n=1 Tax=Sphingorhabdus sp. TaxID=1902408 RepID=UPI0037C8DFE0
MKLSLTDFRAFASTGALEVRPLTFLVGENSSGKTSFLAALSYIWRFQERMLSASFNLPPFDLGTFDEIVHRVRGRTRPDTFTLEIENQISIDPRRSPIFFSR